MNLKYFAYALLLTAITTIMNWASMIDSSSSSSGRGSSWSSRGGSGYSGGSHK